MRFSHPWLDCAPVIWSSSSLKIDKESRLLASLLVHVSGRGDLNSGPLDPQSSALTGLRYAPSSLFQSDLAHETDIKVSKLTDKVKTGFSSSSVTGQLLQSVEMGNCLAQILDPLHAAERARTVSRSQCRQHVRFALLSGVGWSLCRLPVTIEAPWLKAISN